MKIIKRLLTALLYCGIVLNSNVSTSEELLQAKAKTSKVSSESDKVYQVAGVTFIMKAIPGGSFEMGSREGFMGEEQLHKVSIKPFHLLEHEVTWAMYQPCIDADVCPNNSYHGGDNNWGKGERPVISISWHDITQYYIPWLNRKTGKHFRLPSEAEWEYAARAGSTTRFTWGDKIGRNRANCKRCGSQWDFKQTAPVKSFSPNAFGLYDMHGNVWEWVQDCWNDSYSGAPRHGAAWTSGDCENRVLRGGSWIDSPRNLASATRLEYSRSIRLPTFGFRLAEGEQ